MIKKAMVICTLLSFSITFFSCECFTQHCKEECKRDIEQCLLACADWSPDAVYICNDNCVFAYVDCLGTCALTGDREESTQP